MAPELLILTLGYSISAIIALAFGTIVLMKNPKNKANILFFLFNLAASVFEISYITGVNIADPMTSRFAFLFIMTTPFAVLFDLHLLFTLTKTKDWEKRILYFLYTITTILCIFYIFNPDYFLLPSIPKGFLVNHIVPGTLYYARDTLFYIPLVFFFCHLIYSYIRADWVLRNRLKYFIIANIFTYAMGLIPAFYLYGVPISPIWSLFVSVYTIPLAYAVLRYDLIDIRVATKRAVAYGLAIGGSMFLLIVITSVSNILDKNVPSFPQWVVPLVASIIAGSTGIFVWSKIKEADVLKFEFINVIMHKFRTPLTYIKWSTDTLTKYAEKSGANATENDELKEAVSNVKTAEIRISALIDTLVSLTYYEDNKYRYLLEGSDIRPLINEVLEEISPQMKRKRLAVSTKIPENLPFILLDKEKIKFALQILLDNAVNYTPENGHINISLTKDPRFVSLTIIDSGIGIPKEEIGNLFSKFYRGSNAQAANTEGTGIGLYLAREIVKRHGGEMTILSEGKDKGTTVKVQFPLHE